ncbi:hypothetical protein ACKS0A_12044 [Histoplasma ohiense]
MTAGAGASISETLPATGTVGLTTGEFAEERSSSASSSVLDDVRVNNSVTSLLSGTTVLLTIVLVRTSFLLALPSADGSLVPSFALVNCLANSLLFIPSSPAQFSVEETTFWISGTSTIGLAGGARLPLLVVLSGDRFTFRFAFLVRNPFSCFSAAGLKGVIFTLGGDLSL